MGDGCCSDVSELFLMVREGKIVMDLYVETRVE